MAGMTEMVSQARERQELVVAATAEIKAAAGDVQATAAGLRAAQEEINTMVGRLDQLEYQIRKNYDKLDETINSARRRKSEFHILIDRLGTACIAVMVWRLVEYFLSMIL